VVICLERGANNLHMVQLMPLPPIISGFIKIQNGFAFLVPAYLGCPGWKKGRYCSLCLATLYMQSSTINISDKIHPDRNQKTLRSRYKQ